MGRNLDITARIVREGPGQVNRGAVGYLGWIPIPDRLVLRRPDRIIPSLDLKTTDKDVSDDAQPDPNARED